MSGNKTDPAPPPPERLEAPEGMQADAPPCALEDETAFAEEAQARAAADNPALAAALKKAAAAAAAALGDD
jgi:hypothetical protein